MVRDLPDFDDAVLGTTGNHIVIVGAPCNIQNGSFVSTYQWIVWRNPPDLQKNHIYVVYNYYDSSILGWKTFSKY